MRIAAICGLTLMMTTSAGAEEAVTWKDDVAGWYIGVDTSIANGCFMTASYEAGTFLRVQFNPALDNFQFMVGDPKWASIEEGKLYEIEVAFGSRSPWTGEAEGVRLGSLPALLLNVPFDEDRAATFISELQKMQNVAVAYQGTQIANLALSGTHAAMDEVIACQAAMGEAGESQPAATDPFAVSPPIDQDPFN
jgi:hypothetical protein